MRSRLDEEVRLALDESLAVVWKSRSESVSAKKHDTAKAGAALCWWSLNRLLKRFGVPLPRIKEKASSTEQRGAPERCDELPGDYAAVADYIAAHAVPRGG